METTAARRALMYDEYNLCEMAHRNQLIYKLSEILFGTRTSKSDLLQKITEMVVECSCVVKKIVGKDARRRKTTLPR